INVVRRREAAEELLRLGGDAAICTNEESIPDRVRALTNGEGVRYAIDAVGGATAAAVVQSLAAGGRLLLYGTLSSEPLTLSPRALMVGQKSVAGFWLSEWAQAQGPLRLFLLFRTIGRLFEAGVFASEIGTTFALDEIQTAVRTAEAPGRHG